MEMTFTIEDADLDKLNEILKDINVKECPWFEVQDKHGNKARYYRETQKTGKWIDYSDEGYVECPFCHSATNCDGNKDELHYCFSCGADMRGEQE